MQKSWTYSLIHVRRTAYPIEKQELSYRKQIARKLRLLRTQYVESIYDTVVTLTSRLRFKVTGNGTIGWIRHDLAYYYSSYLTLNIIVTLKCGSEMTQGY